MCGATDALREVLGIADYLPGPIPHARVRTPTRFGSRGNGRAALAGIYATPDPAIAELAREHRLIRDLLADIDRIRGRG